MNLRKLACACCSAVFMLGLASCDGNNDKPDTGPVVTVTDAGKKPDTGVEIKPDTGVVDPGDTGVPPAGEDAGADTGVACVPNCPIGAECGPNGCGGTCGSGCTAPAACVDHKCETGCRASCADKECGEDTCTPPGSCGTCADGKTCVAGKCQSECWKTACTGKECGASNCPGEPDCGTCPSGKVCNAAGKCEERKCSPACEDDQFCDLAQSTPVCIEICDPPNGCKDVEECVPDTANPQTGTCKAPTCNGEQCLPGQVCLDFPAETPNPGEHCSCAPELSANSPDTCLEYGLVCPMDNSEWVTIIPTQCKKPGEFEDCIPSVGCEPPADGGKLDCMKLGTNPQASCFRSCATGTKADSKKCTDPATTCYGTNTVLKNHCYFNFCAFPDCDPATDDTCLGEAAERALLFAPCNSAGSGDGTCLPGTFSDGEEYGICIQGGSATGSCDPDAVRVATQSTYPTMCAVGSSCSLVSPDPANDGKWLGACVQLCNAAGAASVPAVNCTGTNKMCLDVSGEDASVDKSRLGFCKDKCDMYGSDTCADDVLQNKQGCFPTPAFDGTGYCRALKPNAPSAYGTACTIDENDNRNECGDRLLCVTPDNETLDGFCFGFCKTSACSNANVFCNECVGSYCCKPNCTGRCNGEDDGCGGKCTCEAGKKCDTAASPNACVACTANCAGKCSGEDDGCGGKCNCEAGKKCDTAADPDVCVTCTPACDGKCSGQDDGCGGKCNCLPGNKCDTAADPDVCVACTANCDGKCSGEDDGCGGKCNCEAGKKCDTAADPDVCVVCTPTCAAGKCGMDDGCGGKCGCTGAGEWCSVSGDCKTSCLSKTDCPATKPVCDLVAPTGDAAVQPGTCSCKPDCLNKHCGDDGCGGSCGACEATDKCLTPAVGNTLVCGPLTSKPTTMNLCQTK